MRLTKRYDNGIVMTETEWLRDALQKLSAYEDAEEQGTLFPRWIPVTERVPIMGDRVICFGDYGINTVDFVCGDKWCAMPWFYSDGELETGVTHWMPLPEPPKGE